jgi:hypothetical protein
MGVTLLNPIQTDAKDMDPMAPKASFGQRLSFHGGVNITHLLPTGTTEECGPKSVGWWLSWAQVVAISWRPLITFRRTHRCRMS